MSLEDDLLEEFKDTGKIQDLERGLLIVSGADTENKIEIYKEKIDQIDEQFQKYMDKYCMPKTDVIIRAKALDLFLWRNKDKRYTKDNGYKLTEGIDNWLANKLEGNCQVLTSTYSVLGLRNDLPLNIFVSILRDGDSRHINSLLKHEEKKIIIENSFKKGFDIKIASKFDEIYQDFPIIHLLGFSFYNRAKEKRFAWD